MVQNLNTNLAEPLLCFLSEVFWTELFTDDLYLNCNAGSFQSQCNYAVRRITISIVAAGSDFNCSDMINVYCRIENAFLLTA